MVSAGDRMMLAPDVRIMAPRLCAARATSATSFAPRQRRADCLVRNQLEAGHESDAPHIADKARPTANVSEALVEVLTLAGSIGSVSG